LRAFAISMDDVLEINNPDTIFDLVSDGNQVLVFMDPGEPLHMLFALPEGFVQEVMDSPYSHFQDFGDFSILFLKLENGRLLSVISPDVVVFIGASPRLAEGKSIHSALVREIVDFVKSHGNPDVQTFEEMGRIRREFLQAARAIEDMYRMHMDYFPPHEGYMLLNSSRGLRWKAFDLEDRREALRLNLLKPVRRFRRLEYLLLGIAGMILIGLVDNQIFRIGAGLMLMLSLIYLVRRSEPLE